jgi:16S rRNA (cytosine1402-N4)-methyltransferase
MASTVTLTPYHIPVLSKEVLKGLQTKAGGYYIDCTVGLGGHAKAILQNILPGGRLLGIDVDPEALHIAKNGLRNYGNAVILVNDNFTNLEAICSKYEFQPVDGILFDLGASSWQLDSAQRGFSFQSEAPLDMRFTPGQGPTAAEIINSYSEQELVRVIKEYGEESHSRQIASLIVQNRPIYTTSELARLVKHALRYKYNKINPATKTFMAFRITVNHELENLKSVLEQVTKLLRSQGRLVVISYHSLEDRIVKQFMKREASDCICPPEALICRCGHKASLRLITKKVIRPSLSEIENNPRSRSGKMRVAEHLG